MILQQYQKMKDSGIEWADKIPEHWEEQKLKLVTDCLDGKRIPLNGEERGGRQGPYPYYGASGLFDHIDDYIFDEELVCLSEDGENLRSRVLPISFVINGKTWVNNHAHVLRPTKMDANYLAYLLDSIDMVPYLEGATRMKLNQGIMNNILLPYPPNEEQKLISNYLDKETRKIDIDIQKNQKLIELVKEKRKAAINHAVTKGLDPSVPMKDSRVEWIGEIPKHWKVRRLRYLAAIDTGNKNTVDNEEAGEYQFFVRSQQVEHISTYSYDGEAVLTAGDGVGVGKVFHYVNGKFDFHQRVYKISDFVDIIGKFFYYYIKENFHKEVIKLSAKSTVDSLRLYMFQNFPVAFGTKDEQKQITKFLDSETRKIDSLISKTESQIKKLQEYRQSLISAAVTGQIDVRNEVEKH